MILGIDLGTTFSSTAFLKSSGQPKLVPSQRTPDRYHSSSVIHIGARGCIVGDLVEDMLDDDPKLHTARFAKLSMGQEVDFYTDHDGNRYRPEAISALILRKLKEDAEVATGEIVSEAVITVPAHFNEKMREATVNAGILAGLNIRGIIDEPVAAAAYFGLEKIEEEKTTFVFDMGGGTLDATIVQIADDGLFVLATEGEKNVGGKNFDEVIMDLILGQYQMRYGDDIQSRPDVMQRLRRYASQIKIDLTEKDIAYKPMNLGGNMLKFTLSREMFEDAAEVWLEAAKETCERSLAQLQLNWDDMDEVVLTGGSSLMPCVMRMVREASGLPPDRIKCKEPRYAVAYGAALLAEQRYGDAEVLGPTLKQTVTGNELGIRAYDNDLEKAVFLPLVEKNMPVPVSNQRTVYTRTADQQFVSLEILQRKDQFSELETLGQFRFGPLNSYEPNHPVQVTMGYDESGRVTVEAMDELTGHSVQQEYNQAASANLADQFRMIKGLKIIS